jgi:L-ascorbate metabolism protein UlaG (beta-lactamase superfamily)
MQVPEPLDTWNVRIIAVGGPTVLLQIGALRLLTDPTFDPADSWYRSGPVELQKITGPALDLSDLPPIDAVLLSHDQHADNLDNAGRAFLPRAIQVLTTRDGAARLGGTARGLDIWESIDVVNNAGDRVRVTATPARHGPPGIEPVAGAVVGWILERAGQRTSALYISGDTVLCEAVEEIARRFRISVAVLHLGAARVAARGPEPLTFTGQEAARLTAEANIGTIIPVHYEGWAHFSEGQAEIEAAFVQAGLAERLLWLPPGEPVSVTV